MLAYCNACCLAGVAANARLLLEASAVVSRLRARKKGWSPAPVCIPYTRIPLLCGVWFYNRKLMVVVIAKIQAQSTVITSLNTPHQIHLRAARQAMIKYHVQVWDRVVRANEGYWTGTWIMSSSFSGATLLVWPQAEETFLSFN